MDINNISILKLFRKNIIVNISMILTIVMCLGISLSIISGYDYNSRILINTLGKQRALTQMISKDSTTVYAILEALENNKQFLSKDDFEKKLSAAQKSIKEEKKQFEDIYLGTKKGYIKHGNKFIYFNSSLSKLKTPLSEIDDIWPKFSDSIDILSTAKGYNDKVINATVFINEHDAELYSSSDTITNIIITTSKTEASKRIYAAIILMALAILIISLSLVSFYKHFLYPIDELYKGISKLGFIDNTLNKSIANTNDILPLVSDINEVFDKLNKLIRLIENINTNSSFGEILDYIYHAFSPFIPYTYIGIALIEDDETTLRGAYGISDEKLKGLPEGLLDLKTPIYETSLGHVIATGEPRIINDLNQYTFGKPVKFYNKVIMDAGINSSITLPLKFNNRAIGIIFFSSKLVNVYQEKHVRFLQTLANSIAIAFEKNILIGDLLYSSILALAKLAESRDEDTGEHLNRMKVYSKCIAQFLYEDSNYKELINIEYIEDIEKFSPLHDIGKVKIRDKVLLKPGKLTEEEFEEMKQHTKYGSAVLKAADKNLSKNSKSMFTLGIEIAEYHHEKWNGSGYPLGLKGKDIPLSARIVAVADVFDALTSKRPYKEAMSAQEAFDIIVKESGLHFDPEIISTFVKNKNRIFKQYWDFRDC